MTTSRREFMGLFPATLLGGSLLLPSLFEGWVDSEEIEEFDGPISGIPNNAQVAMFHAESVTGPVQLTIPKGVAIDGFRVGFGDLTKVSVDAQAEFSIWRTQQGFGIPLIQGAVNQRAFFSFQAKPGCEFMFKDVGGVAVVEGKIEQGCRLDVWGWWL